MQKRWLLLYGLIVSAPINSQMYVYNYPVAVQDDTLYFIHQECQHLHLFKFNLTHRYMLPEIYSFNQEMLHSYSIGNFQLMPDKAGYSFIDNGRLRIRHTHRRSPTSVDFIQPIYDINRIQWLETNKGIICARYHQHFGIFYFTVDGRTGPLIWTGKADYLFPHLIEDQLFCIERCKQDNSLFYRLIQIPCQKAQIFSIEWDTLSFDEKVAILMGKKKQELFTDIDHHITEIVGPTNNSVAYIKMIDRKTGFYLVYQDELTDDASCLHCSYHMIEMKEGLWQTRQLFTFTIPRDLLIDPQNKLIEHIVPLLPKHFADTLYFVDSQETDHTIGIFTYNLQTGSINKKLWQDGHMHFAPYVINNALYHGSRY